MDTRLAHASKTVSRKALAVVTAACVALCIALPAPALAATYQASPAPAKTQGKMVVAQAKKAKKKTKVHKIRTAKQWHNIAKYKGGTFKVMKNIRLTSTKQYLTISKNKKYTIDLNGKTVKTTYSGVSLRTACPLYLKKGTVVMKSSKKNAGMLYSTETAAVTAVGKSKFYLKSGSVVDDATEFRSDITSAIMLSGSAKCYLQGTCAVQSIGNGVALLGSSRLYATGNPYVRAGANTYTSQFTHYGCGINIASKNARVSLQGGSYGTKASPDAGLSSAVGTFYYAQSANYPILDQYGYALENGIGGGYKCIDAQGNTVAVRGSNLNDYYNGVTAPSWDALLASFGMKSEKRYTTYVKDVNGYYTVYVVKA